MPNFLTPYIRYSAFSNFLSGVSLYPRTTPPQNRAADFFDLNSDLFCGVADEKALTRLLNDVGMIRAWHAQGHQNIWLTLQNDADCHTLSVWTAFQEKAELLMHAILWLEYIHIDALDLTVPSICVEHLRLQNPRASFGAAEAMPGQDYPSSGLFKTAFALAQNLAAKTGALCLTEVPQFFHTAWLFSSHFEYVDPEMAAVFKKMNQDLLPPRPLFEDVLRVSRAFEAKRVLCNQSVWCWPTELQAFPLTHDFHFQSSFQLEDKSFVISDDDNATIT